MLKTVKLHAFAIALCAGAWASPAFADAASCVSVTRTSGATFISNLCPRRISVHWIDQGYCSTGCAEVISAGNRNSVTGWQGNVQYAACWDYDYPKGFKENPHGSYSCQ